MEQLYLNHCKIQGTGAAALFSSLQKGCILHLLNVSNNAVRSAKSTMAALMTFLMHAAALEFFYIDECKISNPGGVAIGDALIKGSRVLNISARENEIGDEGARKIAVGIETNAKIRSLNLSKNNINDAGGELIARSLLRNESLGCLDISYNNLRMSTAAVIQNSIKSNCTIAKICLQGNTVLAPQLAAITHVLQKNKENRIKKKAEDL